MEANIPESFAAEMLILLGEERARTLLQALNEESPSVSVRTNTRKRMDSDPFGESSPVEWCPEGRYLPRRPLFTLMPEMHGGAFYVQEAGSMIHSLIVRHILSLRGAAPGTLRVLDVCAAPGGKTTAMLNALPDGTAVVANEYSPQRARVLVENIVKYGYPSVAVTSGDARCFSAMSEEFDIVAVDAPCSGEGMMRKEEVARTQWSPGLTESCAALQREILEGVLPALRPGGYLIYSTCTFNRREDEDIAEWLVNDHGMEAMPLPLDHIPEISSGLSDTVPCYRFIPGISRSEGLFVAVLRKPLSHDAATASDSHSFPQNSHSGNRREKVNRKGDKSSADSSICRNWVMEPENFVWRNEGEDVRAIPHALANLITLLPKGIRLLNAGIEVATLKGRDYIPAPSLALSTSLNRDAFPAVPLSREEALRYLRHEAFPLPPGTPKGFVVVTHNGVMLGWMKNIGNRANNLWPVYWRVRLQDAVGGLLEEAVQIIKPAHSLSLKTTHT